MHEILLAACSQKEELEWRERLENQPDIDDAEEMMPEEFGFLDLNIKSLEPIQSRPGMASFPYIYILR